MEMDRAQCRSAGAAANTPTGAGMAQSEAGWHQFLASSSIPRPAGNDFQAAHEASVAIREPREECGTMHSASREKPWRTYSSSQKLQTPDRAPAVVLHLV